MPGKDPPSTTTTTTSHWRPLIDEIQWVIQIRHTLDQDLDDDDGVPVSVFNVPKALLETKPDAYIPQLIALGPYHHWRPELYEMERYKLAAAKRTQKYLAGGKKCHDLVDAISKLDNRVRANYHRHLDFNGETLAWMMAVDACFLLEFLQVYQVDPSGRVLKRVSSKMAHLVDLAGRKSAHNIILRDIMMLENQIPLFLLRQILQSESRLTPADEILTGMLTGFMKDLSPFKMVENFPAIEIKDHAHLLELLYHVLVPKHEEGDDEAHEIEEEDVQAVGGGGSREEPRGDPSAVKQLLTTVWGMASTAGAQPVLLLKKAVTSKPVMFVVKAPWKLLTSLPGVSVLAKPVEYLFSSLSLDGKDGQKNDKEQTSGNGDKKPPLVEEIMIPSVEQLIDAGVRFCPTNGDLTTISFDPKAVTFSLPVVTLDLNTEVVLRNLVAYETSVASGPMVLTRYTELMNGIIDTEEDAKLLREKGIILNHMKSDGDVADLWNGMTKSVRLSKVPFMDKAIEDVNRYHDSRWKVKTQKFMKKYVFGSWPFLTFIAAILLLLLTGLQAFCSVYSCARWFNVPSVGQQP